MLLNYRLTKHNCRYEFINNGSLYAYKYIVINYFEHNHIAVITGLFNIRVKRISLLVSKPV